MRGHRWLCVFLILGTWGTGDPVRAELTPEIQLGSRGVMSFNVDNTSETTSAVNDFSDSGVLLGFRQKLYSQYRGQMVVGFQFPDADSDLGQVFFHQMFLQVENRTNILKMGRSRVRSALVEFPSLRDDDALHFTDVLNPFSAGENSEDNQYGDVLEVARIFGQRYWLRVHGEHFTETPEPPATVEEDFSLNALGFSLLYQVPESQRWNRGLVDQVGIGFNNFLTDRPGYSNEIDQALKSVLFSAVLNLRPDPVHFWDLRYQSIFNLGFDEIAALTSYGDLTRARSFASFTSLRYLYRKREQPTAQVSAAFGYKTFPDLANSTHQLQLVVNGLYRLGENFDVGLQYQYRRVSGDLRSLFERDEHRIQAGLVYSVEQMWNDQFDDRGSLLNLEHGYIP